MTDLLAPRARVAVLALIIALWSAEPPMAGQDPVRDALDLYSRGEHAAAVALPGGSLTLERLLANADAWIAERDDRRRRVHAAAYVLEVTWAATRHADNAYSDPRDCAPPADGLNLRVSSCRAIVTAMAWACARMPRGGPPGDAEAWWWRASVGMLEDARAWAELVGVRRSGTGPSLNPDLARETAEGHLAHAGSRLPDEPRWRLAAIIARASLDARGRPWSPDRADVLRDENLRNPGGGSRVDRDLQALAVEAPDLVGEIALHLGYRALQRRRWQDALAHLQRATSRADEPFILATADYFGGYAYERLARADDATAAYRRAHTHAPHVRNLSTLLAMQLFLANQRDEAHATLTGSMRAVPEPVDLRTMFERGAARLVPEYIDRMREALR